MESKEKLTLRISETEEYNQIVSFFGSRMSHIIRRGEYIHELFLNNDIITLKMNNSEDVNLHLFVITLITLSNVYLENN